jgi:hypothetical protein
MDTNALLLLLCAALARVSTRPFHVPDLQAYIRAVTDQKVSSRWASSPASIPWYDASGIFAVLHNLEVAGELARDPRGFVLTVEGEQHAESIRRQIGAAAASEIDRVAEQSASRAA